MGYDNLTVCPKLVKLAGKAYDLICYKRIFCGVYASVITGFGKLKCCSVCYRINSAADRLFSKNRGNDNVCLTLSYVARIESIRRLL